MITTLQESSQQEPAVGAAVVARLHGVSKNYGDVRALRQVDFNIHAGELVALLGPNGAGKTTAVKLFLGLAKPNGGTVSIFGGNPIHPEVRVRTGAMLQVARVPETLRVREHIELFSSYYPEPLSIGDTLAAAGLESIKDRLFGDLSGGQRQRVLFALALCGNPDLLFLDEPTVGLDVEARRALWDQIRKLVARGKSVLLTTHYLEEADALADRIVVIHQGAVIAEGTPSEVKAQTAGKKIRCVTRLEAAVVLQMPGVQNVHRDREALVIRAAVAEPVIRELLARDPQLSGIEVYSAGLEEAFLALTRDGMNA
ncbi:MAG TPA: ABC transporter ATP-binding protein [Terriglobales bacterium]|jgi:ABC-2 type transport system ATP-binding protein|nr:ABC transporter ATP-binding protein [Terriglobales bacterium]